MSVAEELERKRGFGGVDVVDKAAHALVLDTLERAAQECEGMGDALREDDLRWAAERIRALKGNHNEIR